MKKFIFIDGHTINTDHIEIVEPVKCGYATEDSDAEEGDVIGVRIITHNTRVTTQDYTPEEFVRKYMPVTTHPNS